MIKCLLKDTSVTAGIENSVQSPVECFKLSLGLCLKKENSPEDGDDQTLLIEPFGYLTTVSSQNELYLQLWRDIYIVLLQTLLLLFFYHPELLVL